MMVIINDILDFSKITEGKLSLEKIDFNLFELINKAIIAFKYAAQTKNIELLFSFDKKINPIVKSDPVRINQIIINLLNNAIKFTTKGKVTVNVILEKKEAPFSIITFSVVDTGIGISKENQQLIFESFSQEDSSISRKFGGTGLGLAISKELIEMLGGTIQLDSEKGKGSRFYFSLPLDIGNIENIKTLELDEDKKLDLSNVKILIAEDHKINQFYIKSVLANWNNIPDIAENGLEAIEMVKIKAYDIVFMDKEMPEMSGIEATRIMRTQLNVIIPIIALTAATLPETLEELRQSGITDIVIKPFQPNDLLATILKHTDITV
jgi:CheY-like chemotaxis protein/two-component sensor histidine kinase